MNAGGESMISTELFGSFEIEIPANELQAAIHRKLERDPPQKGFRFLSGMPMPYILKKCGTEFLEDVFKTLLNKQAQDYFSKHNIDVAITHFTGLWNISDRPLRYKYRVDYERFPVFDVKGLDDIRPVDIKPWVIDDAHIDVAIEQLRRAHSEWKLVDRPAKIGDQVAITFEGRLEDGQSFPGGSAENVGILLGGGGMLPEFDAAIVGVEPHAAIEIPVKFPDDYQTTFLAGKSAVFYVEILSIAEFVLVPIDDAFARKCGCENGLTLFRDAVKAHLIRQHAEQDQIDISMGLLQQLTKANEVPVPRGLIGLAAQTLHAERAKQSGVSPEQLPVSEATLDAAYSQVLLSVVSRRLVQQERLQIDDKKDLTEQVVAWLNARALQNMAKSQE
jgi:trigger factor